MRFPDLRRVVNAAYRRCPLPRSLRTPRGSSRSRPDSERPAVRHGKARGEPGRLSPLPFAAVLGVIAAHPHLRTRVRRAELRIVIGCTFGVGVGGGVGGIATTRRFALVRQSVRYTRNPGRGVKPLRCDSVAGFVQQDRGPQCTFEGRSTLSPVLNKACPVDTDGYLLRSYRCIEPNPVRAGMVSAPGDYRWSSYHANASGQSNALLTPHPAYLALGTDSAYRQHAYARLVAEILNQDEVALIRLRLQR